MVPAHRPHGRAALLLALAAAASAASLTRRSVGQRCVVPLLLRPRPARAEVYDGSSPLELVDDVAAAIEREFYDASLMKSAAWRAAVAAARERALDADGAASGPAIVADLCKATGDPYTRFLPPQLAAALRSTAASGAAATGGVGLRLAAEDAAVAEVATAAAAAAALRGAPGTRVAVAFATAGPRRRRRALVAAAPEVELLSVDEGATRSSPSEASPARQPPASTPRWRPRGAGRGAFALDLRGDGGGNVDGALDAAALFLGGSALVATVKTRAATEARVAPRGPPRYSEPLAVLVDRGTASASELLAGALQARKRAVLVGGARTYGKARIQRALDLPGGGSVLVSRASYLTPDGADLNGVGLKADVLCDGDARACLASDPRTRL
ncbi:serine-type peptidase [Aureococcus anophagefferens]|nr:serine-type peptidase [Aureococcus anophagefferens]